MTLSLSQEKVQKIESQCLEVYRAQEITLLERVMLGNKRVMNKSIMTNVLC